MSTCRRLGLVALVAVAVQPAWAATLSLEVASEALYADMPFTLTLSARGFEEEPTPDPPELAIDGCEVTYLGVGPSAVSTHIQVINGRRSEWREVVFKYRWRVHVPAPGRYTVPPLRLEQAGTVATQPGGVVRRPRGAQDRGHGRAHGVARADALGGRDLRGDGGVADRPGRPEPAVLRAAVQSRWCGSECAVRRGAWTVGCVRRGHGAGRAADGAVEYAAKQPGLPEPVLSRPGDVESIRRGGSGARGRRR